ncbi:MAG: DUF4230 domain-containing protein [Deltaproteobacteria bacterium]|nr:DUF4230 domain-containing protein [Deltaproteobacteria bacterium]
MRFWLALLLAVFAAVTGALLAYILLRKPEVKALDTPAVVEKVRETAKLETLDVSLYKKVEFAPDPPASDSVWGDLGNWVKEAIHKPHGKAIVFAEAHLSIDLRKLDEARLRVVDGSTALVVLPPVVTQVELKPGETEIIGSNLDAAETSQLFAKAKDAFEREVQGDAALRARAQDSARKSLGALLGSLGMRVQFVDALPPAKTLN